MKSLALPRFCEVESAMHELLRLTGRAAISPGEDVECWVPRCPGTQFQIHAFEEGNVLCVVPAHHGPGFFVPPHAAKPQMLAGMWKLAPNAREVLPELIE